MAALREVRSGGDSPSLLSPEAAMQRLEAVGQQYLVRYSREFSQKVIGCIPEDKRTLPVVHLVGWGLACEGGQLVDEAEDSAQTWEALQCTVAHTLFPPMGMPWQGERFVTNLAMFRTQHGTDVLPMPLVEVDEHLERFIQQGILIREEGTIRLDETVFEAFGGAIEQKYRERDPDFEEFRDLRRYAPWEPTEYFRRL